MLLLTYFHENEHQLRQYQYDKAQQPRHFFFGDNPIAYVAAHGDQHLHKCYVPQGIKFQPQITLLCFLFVFVYCFLHFAVEFFLLFLLILSCLLLKISLAYEILEKPSGILSELGVIGLLLLFGLRGTILFILGLVLGLLDVYIVQVYAPLDVIRIQRVWDWGGVVVGVGKRIVGLILIVVDQDTNDWRLAHSREVIGAIILPRFRRLSAHALSLL